MNRKQCMRLIADGMSMSVDNYGQYFFTYAENGGDIEVDGISILDNSDCQYNLSIDNDDDMICYTGVYIDRECPICKKYNKWNDDDYICNCIGNDPIFYTYDNGRLDIIMRKDFVWFIYKGEIISISCNGCNVSTKIPYTATVDKLENYKLLLGGN